MNGIAERTFTALERAVTAQLVVWRALRELEQVVGCDFDSQEYVCELALDLDTGGKLTHRDAKELLGYLKRDYGISQIFGPN